MQILTAYLSDRTFYFHYGKAKSRDKLIAAGVPQGSVLGPILYLLYTADVPAHSDITLATFADDIRVLSSHANYNVATRRLQVAITEIVNWATKWKIKINARKTVRVDWTLHFEYTTTILLSSMTSLSSWLKAPAIKMFI